MKLASVLGLALATLLLLVSQNAYCGDVSLSSLKPVSGRSPASVQPYTSSDQSHEQALLQAIRDNTIPAPPVEGKGIGAQVAVLRFGT